MKEKIYEVLKLNGQNTGKKMYSLLLAGVLAFGAQAQVALYEPFTATFNPASAGWNVQNLSSPAGTASWFQGNASFNALAGGPTDYFAVNFNSTASTGVNNTISNWLITPTLNLVNGAIVQFATRTTANSNFADRLQLYYSDAGAGTNVGTTAGTATNTAGTFTNIILDLNSAQNASGYPGFWIAMTATLSGITTPTVGRLAFRYYLTNAGAAGTTGNFIGIDEFRYSLPCNHAPVFAAWNVQPCSGNPVILSVIGSGTTAINSYSWSTAANTSTTTFIPQNSGMNSIYVLMETTPGCVDLEIANLNVAPSPTVTVGYAPTGHICSGKSITLTASGATSYTYVVNSSQSTTVNPIGITAPTVTALSTVTMQVKGRGQNNCVNTRTITLSIDPNPTVTLTGPTSALCVGKAATLTANGAFSYTWSGGSTSTQSTVAYTAAAPAGTKTFSVTGESIEGCRSASALITVTVSSCTGIDEQGFASNATIYPNPFKDYLYIKDFKGQLTIYNELGQEVSNIQVDSSDIIDSAKLPAGIYFIKLNDGQRNPTVKKFVKE